MLKGKPIFIIPSNHIVIFLIYNYQLSSELLFNIKRIVKNILL